MVKYAEYMPVKLANGYLVGPDTENMLKNVLSEREYKLRGPGVRYAIENNFVLYDKGLLDEPALDEMIVDLVGYTFDFKKIRICYPDTVMGIREFKVKPIINALSCNMVDVAKKLLSPEHSVDVRFKGYAVFNQALDIDKRNGFNTYAKIL